MSSQYSVAIDLKVQQAFNRLKELTDKFTQLDRVTDKIKSLDPFQNIERSAAGAASATERVGAAAQRTEKQVGGLGNAVRGLAGAYALMQGAKFVFAKTAELESQTASLKVLIGELGTAKKVISELQTFANVTPFTGTELIDAAKRLKAFGVDTSSLVDTVKRLGDVSGATGADLSGVVTAYGQIQAKGRLQGEELLQLQERGIALQPELQRMYGLTGEAFSKALQKGQFSAKAVEVALKNLTSTGGAYANGAIAQSDTLNGKLSTLQDGVDNLARRVGEVLTPALKEIFNLAISTVDAINKAIGAGLSADYGRRTIAQSAQLSAGARGESIDTSGNLISEISRNPQRKNLSGVDAQLEALQATSKTLQRITADGLPDKVADRILRQQAAIQKLTKDLVGYRSELVKTQKAGGPVTAVIPPLLGGKGGKSDAEKAAEKARKAAEAAAKKAAADQASLDKQLATNRIELDGQVFDNQQALIKQRYELENQLQGKLASNWELTFVGVARSQAGLINELVNSQAGYKNQLRELDAQIEKAQQAVKAAKAGVAVAAIQPAPVIAAATGGGGGGSASGGYVPGSGPYPMTSGRGPRWGRTHHGIDYGTPIGTPISTTLPGKVTDSGWEKGYGNYAEVTLSNGVKAFWAHLSEIVLKEGMSFNAGQIIAKTGNTGRGTGPHLHSGDNSIGNAGDQYTRLGGRAIPGASGPAAAAARPMAASGPLSNADSMAGAQGNVDTAQAQLEGLQSQRAAYAAKAPEMEKADFAKYILQTTNAFREEAKATQDSTAQLELRSTLESKFMDSGFIDAEVKKLEISQRLAAQQSVLDKALETGLTTQEAYTAATDALKAAAEGAAAAVTAQGAAIDAAAKAANQPMVILAKRSQALKTEMDALVNPANQIIGAAGAIGSAFGDAFKGIASGAMTAQEAMAQMFQSIASHFLDMAAQMIAKAIEMQAMKLLTGLLGGALGGIGGGGGGDFSGAFGDGGPTFNPGAFTGPKLYAEGGLVTRPTMAMIGEGGQSEVVIPQSKIGAAMANYQPGSGAAGLARAMNGPEGGSESGGGGVSISYTGPTLNFNGDDYLPRSAVPELINAAAKQGAEAGHARVFGDLRNSRGQRSRIGMR